MIAMVIANERGNVEITMCELTRHNDNFLFGFHLADHQINDHEKNENARF